MWLALVILSLVSCAALACWLVPRPRGYARWLGPYLLQAGKRRPPTAGDEVHVLLCFADHFEPKSGGADVRTGQARVDHWVREFPRRFGHFRDSSGRQPRYTFFFPLEEYEPGYLDALAGLCHHGF